MKEQQEHCFEPEEGAAYLQPVKTEEKDKAARREMSLEGQLLEKDFEIQRLKALLEQQVKKQVRSGIADRYWQQFAAENNL